jgi:hypothetical protein
MTPRLPSEPNNPMADGFSMATADRRLPRPRQTQPLTESELFMACRLFQELPHVSQIEPAAAQDMNGGLPKPIDESEVRLQYRSAIARLLWGARPS